MGCVLVPPFEVRPSVFELGHAEGLLVKVLFAPTDVETYTQDLTLICDNCQVHTIQLTGMIYFNIKM